MTPSVGTATRLSQTAVNLPSVQINVVCSEFGIDSGSYSFGYLAGWGGGGEKAVAAIRGCGERIAGAAKRILAAVDETA